MIGASLFLSLAVGAWSGDPLPPPTMDPGTGSSSGKSDGGGGYRSVRASRGDSASPASSPAADSGPDGNSQDPDKPAVAATVADARDNMPSLVETYIATHGQNGYIPLKLVAKGPAKLLRFQGVQKGSVRAVGTGRFSAIVRLKDKAGHSVPAKAEVDMSGDDWHVVRITKAPPPKKDDDQESDEQ